MLLIIAAGTFRASRMSDDYDERERFFSRRTDKTIISKSFTDHAGRKLRIATRVGEVGTGLQFATIQDDIVLRQTLRGRYEIKATFLEDERAVRTLTIQRFNSKSGPDSRVHFSFVGDEIDTLLSFVASIRSATLPDSTKLHLTDENLRNIVLDQGQARRIFEKYPDLFREIAEREDITRDLIAIGYRRRQLEYFERLLNDTDHFNAEQERLNVRPEDVWQQFFEANTWIFGYGLSYQFVSTLDERKLEQVIRGHDLVAAGKRSDALMKTRGVIGSLCFVEVKRHDTPLLGSQPYRPDAWAPSTDLSGGVAQVQATVQAAVDTIGRRLMPKDQMGNPTGEVVFNFEPRSCLVIGSLGQFQTPNGPNEMKFRSFELFRRNTWRPEIMTFDELLQRAKFIVDHGEQDLHAPR
jgi:hypothetical protein